MEFYSLALIISSILTSLLTEAFKQLFSENKISYKPNILAAVMSVIVTFLMILGYIIYTGILVTPQTIVTAITLIILSFLCATLGYDKVIQTLNQIGKRNG